MAAYLQKDAKNVASKIDEKGQLIGQAGKKVYEARTRNEIGSYLPLGRRNLLINGDFRHWQRATSSSSNSAAYTTADRWWVYRSSGTGSYGQSTDVPDNEGFVYSFKNDGSSAISMGQGVELVKAGNPAPFKRTKPYVLSFWTKGPASRNRSVSFRFRDTPWSGTNNVNWAITQYYEVTSEWKRVSIVVMPLGYATNPNSTNDHLGVEWSGIQPGQYITGVQFEEGVEPTPFEHMNPGESLALCQRYFQVVDMTSQYIHYYTSPWGRSNGVVHLPVTLRTPGTVTFQYGSVTNIQPGGGTATPYSGDTPGQGDYRSYLRVEHSGSDPGYQMWTVSQTNNGLRTIFVDAEV